MAADKRTDARTAVPGSLVSLTFVFPTQPHLQNRLESAHAETCFCAISCVKRCAPPIARTEMRLPMTDKHCHRKSRDASHLQESLPSARPRKIACPCAAFFVELPDAHIGLSAAAAPTERQQQASTLRPGTDAAQGGR